MVLKYHDENVVTAVYKSYSETEEHTYHHWALTSKVIFHRIRLLITESSPRLSTRKPRNEAKFNNSLNMSEFA